MFPIPGGPLPGQTFAPPPGPLHAPLNAHLQPPWAVPVPAKAPPPPPPALQAQMFAPTSPFQITLHYAGLQPLQYMLVPVLAPPGPPPVAPAVPRPVLAAPAATAPPVSLVVGGVKEETFVGAISKSEGTPILSKAAASST